MVEMQCLAAACRLFKEAHRRSGERLLDERSAIFGQPVMATVEVEGEFEIIQSHQAQDRRGQIAHMVG